MDESIILYNYREYVLPTELPSCQPSIDVIIRDRPLLVDLRPREDVCFQSLGPTYRPVAKALFTSARGHSNSTSPPYTVVVTVEIRTSISP